jgi:hypothetical protein
LVRIVRDPFSLRFGAKSDIPIGTNMHGFVVVKLTPKFEKKKLPSGDYATVDVSELTLKRGDRSITLIKGRRGNYDEHVVYLVDQPSGKQYVIRTGNEITIRSRRLRLREVDVKQLNCILEDVKSGKMFTIRQIAQQPLPHVQK